MIGYVKSTRLITWPFNVFHGNLAFSDLLTVSGKTVHSEITCKLAGSVIKTTYTVSLLTLIVMSKDRYDLVTKPLENKSTWKQNTIKLVFVWLFALATCLILTYVNTLPIVDDELKCTNRFSSNGRLIC